MACIRLVFAWTFLGCGSDDASCSVQQQGIMCASCLTAGQIRGCLEETTGACPDPNVGADAESYVARAGSFNDKGGFLVTLTSCVDEGVWASVGVWGSEGLPSPGQDYHVSLSSADGEAYGDVVDRERGPPHAQAVSGTLRIDCYQPGVSVSGSWQFEAVRSETGEEVSTAGRFEGIPFCPGTMGD